MHADEIDMIAMFSISPDLMQCGGLQVGPKSDRHSGWSLRSVAKVSLLKNLG